MTKITYIWHDCFVVSLHELTIVFDFWKDPTTESKKIPIFITQADKSKPLYVFVSHHHKDHFTKQIFEWENLFEKVTYIISEDTALHIRHLLSPGSIYKGHKPERTNIVILKSGESFTDSLILVKAYGSTDIGNSYYVKTCQKNSESFFHAGDLNAWLWKDESTQQEVEASLSDFMKIINRIREQHSMIDFVMFPVDSRIGTDYFTGAQIFVREIFVKHFFPMHFSLGENETEKNVLAQDASKLELYANKERGEYICLLSPYSSFLIS